MRKYDLYRMINNKTPLSAEYFNPIWKDIDSRLDALENVKISWEETVRIISEFGIKRIEEFLRPNIGFLNTKKAEAQNIVNEIAILRANADTMINTTRDDAINQINAVKTQTLNEIEQAKQNAINQLDLKKIYAMTFFFGGN